MNSMENLLLIVVTHIVETIDDAIPFYVLRKNENRIPFHASRTDFWRKVCGMFISFVFQQTIFDLIRKIDSSFIPFSCKREHSHFNTTNSKDKQKSGNVSGFGFV